jgi:hypothetical protein
MPAGSRGASEGESDVELSALAIARYSASGLALEGAHILVGLLLISTLFPYEERNTHH